MSTLICSCDAAPAPAGPSHAPSCARYKAEGEAEVYERAYAAGTRCGLALKEEAMRKAVLDEREACARIAEANATDPDPPGDAEVIAVKIRARGTP